MWSERILRRGRGRLRPGSAFLLLVGALVLPARAHAAAEDDLFRQVKVDVFDQNWQAVLDGCEEALARNPRAAFAPQAEFYRARALSRIPGREAEGVEAFRRFIADHPGEKVMVEEAWAAIFSTACAPRGAARAACGSVLRQGLASGSSYVATLAAIHAADTADADLRRRALLTLKKAHAGQTDPEIKNEILIAILKIDPKEVPVADAPAPPRPPSKGPGGSSAKKAPSLIRMTIYNKVEKRYDLEVTLPVAFARMLVEALGDKERTEVVRSAREQGIDLDDIFEAIEKSGAGRLLEVDDADSRIEIWIE